MCTLFGENIMLTDNVFKTVNRFVNGIQLRYRNLEPMRINKLMYAVVLVLFKNNINNIETTTEEWEETLTTCNLNIILINIDY